MIFAYWHDTDHSPIRSFIAHWRALFPEFRVIGDYEVERLYDAFPASIQSSGMLLTL
jgi:hypothetical protein